MSTSESKLELSPERIAAARAWLEDALTHSGRVEEDEIYETLIALVEDASTTSADQPLPQAFKASKTTDVYVQTDGSVVISCSDDYYNGHMNAAEAVALAQAVMQANGK